MAAVKTVNRHSESILDSYWSFDEFPQLPRIKHHKYGTTSWENLSYLWYKGLRHLRSCCTLRAYPVAQRRRLACSWRLGNPQVWLKSWWTTREEREVGMVGTGKGHHDVFSLSFLGITFCDLKCTWLKCLFNRLHFSNWEGCVRLDTLDIAATTFGNLDSKISLVSKALENLQWWWMELYFSNRFLAITFTLSLHCNGQITS